MSNSIKKPTPIDVKNRPKLRDIERRIGHYNSFKESMVRSLSDRHRPGLMSFGARDDNDWTISLIDAWARTCDNLTFYQERISNESYLVTAKENFSLFQLASLVDYKPSPALAASAYLAFEAETDNVPDMVHTISAGIAVKSIPKDGQLPQTFETIEPLNFKPDWNSIKPVTKRRQNLSKSSRSFFVENGDISLRRGQYISYLDNNQPQKLSSTGRYIANIGSVNHSEYDGLFKVDFSADGNSSQSLASNKLKIASEFEDIDARSIETLLIDLQRKAWPKFKVLKAASDLNLPLADLRDSLAHHQSSASSQVQPYLLSVKARLLGHNATNQLILDPMDQSPTIQTKWISRSFNNVSIISSDGGKEVHLYLDRVYDEIVVGDFFILEGRDNTQQLSHTDVISSVETVSHEGYGTTTEVTKISVLPVSNSFDYLDLNRQNVVLYTGSQQLQLAAVPITDTIGEMGHNSILVSGAFLELSSGQSVVISGKRADLPGSDAAEIIVIDQILIHNDKTEIFFSHAPVHSYLRNEVYINANVAIATHGETTSEILGSGSGSQQFQSFVLKEQPLTYISANNEFGRQAQLEIRVNDIMWTQTHALEKAGPEDRVYEISTLSDLRTQIKFGDGINGARLPTGENNIMAYYRKGAGPEGLMDNGQLSLLSKKPAAIRSVTNPLPSSGAGPAENLERSRHNLTTNIMTLGRIVSLSDYKNYAKSFPGISKAHVSWGWRAENRVALVTIASTNGDILSESSGIIPDIKSQIEKVSASGSGAIVKNYSQVFFTLSARVKVHPDYLTREQIPDNVFSAIRALLRQKYGFENRDLGQAVRGSHIISDIQSVPGVVFVDLDLLHRVDAMPSREDILVATRPSRGDRSQFYGVEMLLISNEPIKLELA